MITFETLFEMLRKEKFNQEIQKIEKDFYEQAVKYLEEKSAIVASQKKADSIFSTETMKTKLQLENAKKIIKEIYEKRENKITNLAVVSSRVNIKDIPRELLPLEKKLYQEILEILNEYRAGVLSNTLAKIKPSIKKKEQEPKEIKSQREEITKNKLVRFVKAVPQFVADDLHVYGPFEQEELSMLPEKTARLLVKRNRAEEIKIENS
jgi:DNA replication initiation complex subunit (GINS family)